MFRTIALHGTGGSLAWNYRTAATLGAYTVRRIREDENKPYRFELEATLLATLDSFALSQQPLLFVAPKRGTRNGGLFCFKVLRLIVGTHAIAASLGPPEY